MVDGEIEEGFERVLRWPARLVFALYNRIREYEKRFNYGVALHNQLWLNSRLKEGAQPFDLAQFFPAWADAPQWQPEDEEIWADMRTAHRLNLLPAREVGRWSRRYGPGIFAQLERSTPGP